MYKRDNSEKGKPIERWGRKATGLTLIIMMTAGLPEIRMYFGEGYHMRQKLVALDQEWLLLIKEAMKLGLKKEEVLKFLRDNHKN